MLAKSWFAIAISALSILLFVNATNASKVGKVTFISGSADLVKKSGKTKQVKVNLPVKAGQVYKTGDQSILEITYNNGTVLRLGENSDVVLTGENSSSPFLRKGKLWANIKKLANRKGTFNIKTVTATAAVRGTVFKVEAGADSSSTIGLYEGAVDVGPADTTKIKTPAPAEPAWGKPTEIPGPYEVSLETWVRLNPGNEIHVKKDGKYKTSKLADEKDDDWVKFNLQRDKSVSR